MSGPATEAETLMAAAAQVDVVDLAGRIIANPRRTIVSTGGQLALALAFERTWAIAVEAEVLARALALPAGPVRDHAVQQQAATVRSMMDAIRGRENADGH